MTPNRQFPLYDRSTNTTTSHLLVRSESVGEGLGGFPGKRTCRSSQCMPSTQGSKDEHYPECGIVSLRPGRRKHGQYQQKSEVV